MRPWKPPSNAITAGRPVYSRASLTAFSTASVPALKKAARAPPLIGASAREPLRELDVAGVRDDGEVGVDEAGRLLEHRLDDARISVPDVHHADATGEVDEDVPVDIGDRRALGVGSEDREVNVERGRDRLRLAREQLLRPRAGKLRLDLDHTGRRHRQSRVPEPPSASSPPDLHLTGSRNLYRRRMDEWVGSLLADPIEQYLAVVRRGPGGRARGSRMRPRWHSVTAEGAPSVRMVLVRRVDARGFCFFTNRESRKAAELDATGRAALVFHWSPPLQRQVRVEGAVERLTDDESESYYRTRDRGSQLGSMGLTAVAAARGPRGARATPGRGHRPVRDNGTDPAATVLGWLPRRSHGDRALAGTAEPAPRPGALRALGRWAASGSRLGLSSEASSRARATPQAEA